ncbi:MAG TPA: hypothetical protein PLL20_01425 [Phycisphaerae bacterium]|nr:hypothetical protein [Phycisphaerae bacterium]HRR87234.1 hypothetical protein [Phycisphaerae bacterium]
MYARPSQIIVLLGLLVPLCLAALCAAPGSGFTSGDMLADTSDAQDASQALTEAIKGGASTQEAVDSLVHTLRANPSIVVAVADEDGRTAWALFESGLECVYEVIDEEETELTLPAVQATAASSLACAVAPVRPHGLATSARDSPFSIAQAGWTSYKLPANNRAVLANSLYVTRPLQDVRTPMKTMLEACGYDVQVVDADLTFFENMSQYSVIFIEAHGGRRSSAETTWDSAANTFYNLVLKQNLPACGLIGAEAVLQTTTEVTQDLITQYKEDLECGRLKIRFPTVKRKGLPPVTYRFFGVTPNFVRRHNTGKFPDYALLCLSACRSFTPDGSPWADLMSEKSYGSVTVGWDQRVHYGISARAMLNLFQLMTGSNEQFAIVQTDDSGGIKTIYPLLDKYDPPVPPQTVGNALDALERRGFNLDPITTARLTAGGDTLYGFNQLMLAPAIETFETRGDGKVKMAARCADNAELEFSGGSVNIGTANNGEWEFALPGLRYGPMSLVMEGRRCPPRDLLRWNPLVIKIHPASTTNAFGTCNFEVTYRLSARAIAAGNREGWSVWDPPDSAFSANWDPDGSVVTWSISGNASDPDPMFGTSQCTWSGGNTRAFNEISISPGDTGGLDSMDGKTAWLTVEPPFDLEYTASCSGAFAPDYACGIYGSIWIQVDLGADWTILPGSTTDLLGMNVIEWQACTPTPDFDSARLPR